MKTLIALLTFATALNASAEIVAECNNSVLTSFATVDVSYTNNRTIQAEIRMGNGSESDPVVYTILNDTLTILVPKTDAKPFFSAMAINAAEVTEKDYDVAPALSLQITDKKGSMVINGKLQFMTCDWSEDYLNK